MADTGPLRIGTRGSPLALAQAKEVQQRLAAAHPDLPPAEIAVIRTTGDRVQDRKLEEIGGKGLFTKEIEEALLDGRIDLAVHSMKDMPTLLPPGLIIGCLLPREDPRDALFSPHAASLAGPAAGAHASAPRRCAARPRSWRCAPISRSSSSAAMSTRGWPSWRRARSMPPCWRWRG